MTYYLVTVQTKDVKVNGNHLQEMQNLGNSTSDLVSTT